MEKILFKSRPVQKKFYRFIFVIIFIIAISGNAFPSGIPVIKNRLPMLKIKFITYDETLCFAREEFNRIISSLIKAQYNDNHVVAAIYLGLAGTSTPNDCDKEMEKAKLTREILGDEGYLITRYKRAFMITGYSGYGVLQGVYALIQKSTGLHYVRPSIGVSPLNEIQNAYFKLKLPYSDKPFFKIRGQSISGQLWSSGTPEKTLNWMVRNGLNLKALSVGSYALNKHDYGIRGMKQVLSGHSFLFWLPPNMYFKDHPEYYPLIDGKRIGRGKGYQLTLGNADCRMEIVKRMRDYLKRNPHVTRLAFGANDTNSKGAGWGTDKLDLALDSPLDLPPEGSKRPRSYSTRYIKAANMIVEELNKTNPGIKLHVYAYHFKVSIMPPHCKVHPNLVVEFAPLYRCYSHAINDPNCPRNKMFCEWFDGWAKLTKNIYIRDYYMYPRRGGISKVPVSLYTLKKEINYYKSLGILGMVPEIWGDGDEGSNYKPGHTYGSWLKDPGEYEKYWDSSALVHFAYSRLLWNPDLKVEQIIKDFSKSYYGKSAEPMEKYWIQIHKNMFAAGNPGKVVPENELKNYGGWIYYGPWCIAWNWKTSFSRAAREAFGILDKDTGKTKDKIVELAANLLKAKETARKSNNRDLRYRIERDCDLFERWCLSLGYQLDFDPKPKGKVDFITIESCN